MNPRLTALQRKLDGIQTEMNSLDAAAAQNDDGDLSDNQKAAYTDLVNRAATVKTEIEQATAAQMGVLEAQTMLAKANGGVATILDRSVSLKDAPDLTVGEFLAEFYKAYHPHGSSAPEEFLNRAAKYIDRAQQATADTTGILPTPILGPVIKMADSRRPVFTALTSRPMPPKGKTFQRPRVTQRTTAGTQTEGQALSSQKMTVGSETVTKATQGGYLDITQQDIDWTEPAALELLVQDFVDTYAEWTEGLACDFVEGLIVVGDTASNGSTYSAWTTTNVGTIVTSVVNGVVSVYNRAKRLPDTMFLDLSSWATIASTTNTNNDVTALEMIRRTLSDLMPEITGGSGFRFVVGPQFAANTRVIAATSLMESYENQNGLLQAIQPSTLSVQMAYSGYTAFYGRHEAVVQLATDPTP